MCIRDSEKIAHKGDISLYAVGYGEESGYALLTPEEAGGDLTYERMEDIDLGTAQARRWRYTDAGSRWDFLAAEAGGFFFSIMVAVPEESAEALEEEVEALLSSLFLDVEDTDDAAALCALARLTCEALAELPQPKRRKRNAP